VQTISWEEAQQAARQADAPRPATRTIVTATVGTMLAACACGVLAAALWAWFADPPYLVVDGDSAFQDAVQLGRQFGVEAAFAWACLLASVPLGAVVGALWHRVGWPQALTLVLAGALASLIAWQLGGVLGPDEPRSLLAAAADGDRLYQPLELQAKGLLLTFPIGALVGFIAAVATFARDGAPALAAPSRGLSEGDRDDSKSAPSGRGETGPAQPAQTSAKVHERAETDPVRD
jgi:hypothetical protein